jgi:heme-degrading monooxygenase HmoA
MIARIWHGITDKSKLKEYTEFTKKVAIPDYKSIKGNQGFTFLSRIEDNKAHFTLITYWDSIDSIKQFAGEDYEKAKYYPEDSEYLFEFEEKVVHHHIFAKE